MKNTLSNQGKNYSYIDLKKISSSYALEINKLPYSLRVLLENSLRNTPENEQENIINNFKEWLKNGHVAAELLYFPARVLMQDFTGVPAVVDLAAMREAVKEKGGDPKKINPISTVDLVIDHSVQVDQYATSDALSKNTELEIKRNYERYEFLKWGQEAFDNFNVVPPGTGICHQVNLEFLANVVSKKTIDGEEYIFPDTLVGTDSHTTMINGLGVLGWGVGGIEAEAAMLGRAISMLIPDVIGVKLTGKLAAGITATDLVLTITNKLRELGVVGKFVEFYGEACKTLSLADRATIANMSPEFGSTCAFFPIDQETLNYMHLTGRAEEQINLVENYAKNNLLWFDETEKTFTQTLEIDLSTVTTSLAGPKRPQDLIELSEASSLYKTSNQVDYNQQFPVTGQDYQLKHGDIVIAAITSCTNTSNPAVMIAAGLVARNALKKGLKPKPHVKTSLGPGSQVVAEYYEKSGLQTDLDQFGFNIVGFGCTTCIGNSGPLKSEIEESIKANNIQVASVLSGNRNFEGRVHALTQSNYLVSPPLVVAYSILGNIRQDITTEPLGTDSAGQPVYLKDIWPSMAEIEEIINKIITREMFIEKYQDVFSGEENWQKIPVTKSSTYAWNAASTYIQNPTFFAEEKLGSEINNAQILALFGDSITTDHISPAGAIAANSPAAKYLEANNVERADFNSYGARRGNHEVMMRGTFANIRIKNEMLPGIEGGYTLYQDEQTDIYSAAMQHKAAGTPLVIIAGKEYGTGSSRDWAAKGTLLLGIKAVIAESFERIHRSNLVGMGVLPLIFQDETRKSLKLSGAETVTLKNLEQITPLSLVQAIINYPDGASKEITLKVRIDTDYEMDNFRAGGVLNAVIES